MLNINESMWRDSATTASMAKPNAWGNPDMGSALTRRSAGQFNSSENLENPSATTPVPAASEAARLKFMFTPEDMAETVLFSGGASKIGGLEDAMERLSMVSHLAPIYLTNEQLTDG